MLAVQAALRACIIAHTVENRRFDRPVMRPDGIRVTAIRFTLTGIDDIDKIHVSVIVRVVTGEIESPVLLVRQNTGLGDSRCRILVIALRIILTVVLVVMAEGDRTEDIELRAVLTVGLRSEIVRCRRIMDAVIGIDRTVVRIAQLIEDRLRVVLIELHVGEVRQNDDTSRRQVGYIAYLRGAACLCFRTACLYHLGRRSIPHHLIHAVYLADLFSVPVDHIMAELIADELDLNGRAIRLSACLPASPCRNGKQRDRQGTNEQ